MRLGVALDGDGAELIRERVATDTSGYGAVLDTVVGLVKRTEAKLGRTGTVGVGIPGAISDRTGLVKNADSTVPSGTSTAGTPITTSSRIGIPPSPTPRTPPTARRGSWRAPR
jgi:hypothetical protein